MTLWDWWKSLLLQGSPSAPSTQRLDGRSKALLAASIGGHFRISPAKVT
jgi:hypothetical protein